MKVIFDEEKSSPPTGRQAGSGPVGQEPPESVTHAEPKADCYRDAENRNEAALLIHEARLSVGDHNQERR